MEITINDIKIEAVRGDITKQADIDAVVNAANAQLTTGGGVAGAIHRAAGPQLEKEATKKAPIKPGEAVITGAHELPNKYVIHCLGPRYGIDQPEDKLLSNCYTNALDLAEEKKIDSIAFPSISTGAFGYPKKEATQIAIDSVAKKASNLKNVTLIRFVLFGKEDLDLFEDKMKTL